MKFLLNILRPIGRVLNIIRKFFLNLLFLVVLIGLGVVLFSSEDVPEVPDGGLLVLNPQGTLVEEKTYVSPADRFFNQAMGGSEMPEVLLRDFTRAIDEAADDDRVAGIVLDLSQLWGSGLSKLQLVGQHLQEFRATGKPIYAVGDNFTQTQYYLASYADEIMLHPHGMVLLDGFRFNQTYYASMLEKLDVETHIFRVGSYKSAVEPFMRDSMSEEAREANQAWVDNLWAQYLQDVTSQRDIDPVFTDGYMTPLLETFDDYRFDWSQAALAGGLVDRLATREDMRDSFIEVAGYDDSEHSFRQIDWQNYLRALRADETPLLEQPDNQVRVIVARGPIMDGQRNPGEVGGDTLARQLREARNDDQVKAVVLRIDSPGGSAFASEIIREELVQLRDAGKPVIASMSSTAASGGYWIAAGADEIFATPTTITGSIGVFGMFLTLENSLERIGISTDSVASTEIPALDPFQAMDPQAAQLMQGSIERIYEDFLELVGDARELARDEVDERAQGRVWTGEKALELDLVDQLGELDAAIARAASHAGLDDWAVTYPGRDLSPFEEFLDQMFNGVQAWLPGARQPTEIDRLVWRARREAEILNDFNDPKGAYARCLVCQEWSR